MAGENRIRVDNEGNVILTEGGGAEIRLEAGQSDDLLATLNGLAPVQLAALQQVVDREAEVIGPLIKTLLSGVVAAQKNVVGGNISHVERVRIGDERHYHYHAAHTPLPKALTSLMPKTSAQAIVGRDKDLADLQARLFDHQQVVLVNGLGGLGKTTLAQAYVDTFYDQYHHIAWISHISENIRADIINTGGLLLSLGIDGRGKEQEALFHEIIVGLKRIEARPNLLVIDNADASLSGQVDYLPQPPQWHILVTSRERIDRFELKELGFLSEAEATALFLQHYRRGQISAEAIKDLVQLVDHHTLTIEILAKTAQRQRLPAGRLQRAMVDDLPARVNVGHAGGKIERVRAYLESIFNLSDLSPAEIWLMQQFTCLPPDYHPYDLLQALLRAEESQDEAIFSETLAGLTDKGWLLENRANDSFKMHRIIAEVTTGQHPPALAGVESLIASLTALLAIDQSRDNPIDKFQWIPFGRALLAHFSLEQAASIATLQNNLATVLQALGDYEGAKGLLEKALQSDEQNFGPAHPSTAVSYSNLATVLQALGDYEGALPLAAKAVAIFKNRLPAGHPYIATASNIYQAIQDQLSS